MSAKPETTFTRRVLSHLPRSIYRMKNNNQYTGGIPDIWVSGDKADLWIEMKYLPKTPIRAIVNSKKLLSALQLEWLNQRYDEGRNVAVIIGCPTGGVVLRDKAWEQELTAANYNAKVITHAALTKWIESQVSTR